MHAGHKNGIVPFVPLFSYTPLYIKEKRSKQNTTLTFRAHDGVLKQWDTVGQVGQMQENQRLQPTICVPLGEKQWDNPKKSGTNHMKKG